MTELLDDSGNKITTESGVEISSNVTYNRGALPPQIEAFALTGVSNMRNLLTVHNLLREIGYYQFNYPNVLDFNKFVMLCPVTPFSETSALYNFGSGTNLQKVNDVSFDNDLLSGDASGYYDTGIDPSLLIDDVDNWSMGIISGTDENTSSVVDIGCTDGTDEHSITCRSGGNIVVKNGQSTITTATASGDIHAVMNSQDGTLKSFVNGIEVGSSTAVTGSLSTGQTMYLGALNSSGSDANQSPKRYAFVWVYNGKLYDESIYILHALFNKYGLNEGKIY